MSGISVGVGVGVDPITSGKGVALPPGASWVTYNGDYVLYNGQRVYYTGEA